MGALPRLKDGSEMADWDIIRTFATASNEACNEKV